MHFCTCVPCIQRYFFELEDLPTISFGPNPRDPSFKSSQTSPGSQIDQLVSSSAGHHRPPGVAVQAKTALDTSAIAGAALCAH